MHQSRSKRYLRDEDVTHQLTFAQRALWESSGLVMAEC